MDKNWPAHALVSRNLYMYLYSYINILCMCVLRPYNHLIELFFPCLFPRQLWLYYFYIYKSKKRNSHVIYFLSTCSSMENNDKIFCNWTNKQIKPRHCTVNKSGISCKTFLVTEFSSLAKFHLVWLYSFKKLERVSTCVLACHHFSHQPSRSSLSFNWLSKSVKDMCIRVEQMWQHGTEGPAASIV